MKTLYYQHLKIHQSRNRKLNKLHQENKKGNNDENEQRQISKERLKDVKHNRWNRNVRWNVERKRKRMAKKTGGHIYGPKVTFKKRIAGSMGASNLDNNTLRTSLHSGVDHPLSFMYNEMQRQQRIPGSRRNRYIPRVQKGHLGPRYKVSTRIGKLHHMNVGDPVFDGIDDLTEGSLIT